MVPLPVRAECRAHNIVVLYSQKNNCKSIGHAKLFLILYSEEIFANICIPLSTLRGSLLKFDCFNCVFTFLQDLIEEDLVEADFKSTLDFVQS